MKKKGVNHCEKGRWRILFEDFKKIFFKKLHEIYLKKNEKILIFDELLQFRL